jgi:YD repeat-containing protein
MVGPTHRRDFFRHLLAVLLGWLGLRGRARAATPLTTTAPTDPWAYTYVTGQVSSSSFSYGSTAPADPLGCVTTYHYDAYGRLTGVTDGPGPAVAAGAGAVYTPSPDPAGRPGGLPRVLTFLLPREVRHDAGGLALVLPAPVVEAAVFPFTLERAAYLQLAGGRGGHPVAFELRDQGELVLDRAELGPLARNDPNDHWTATLAEVTLTVPAPGTYEVVLLLAGREKARQTLRVVQAPGANPAA